MYACCVVPCSRVAQQGHPHLATAVGGVEREEDPGGGGPGGGPGGGDRGDGGGCPLSCVA